MNKSLIEENRKNEEIFGKSYDHTWDGYLIRHPDGKLVTPDELTKKFAAFIKKHQLKPYCGGLRITAEKEKNQNPLKTKNFRLWSEYRDSNCVISDYLIFLKHLSAQTFRFVQNIPLFPTMFSVLIL